MFYAILRATSTRETNKKERRTKMAGNGKDSYRLTRKDSPIEEKTNLASDYELGIYE